MPRPHGPGTPGAGQNAPRPGGAPLPGQHLQGRPEPADPDRVRAEIDELLAELNAGRTGASPESAEAGTDITRRAHILEQAHDVLVRALATVDKI